jgi:hypothetical protein
MDEAAATFFGSVLKAIACTPNYNRSADEYARGVLEPAKRIRALSDACGAVAPNEPQMREAIALLLVVLETKGTDMEEREERLQEILVRSGIGPLFPDLLPLRSPMGLP